MKTEIIAIGTELLMGYVIDTNSPYLAQSLLDMGLGTYYQQVVGDNPDRIRESLDLAAGRSDIICLIGGTGPTRDDITKEIVAIYLGLDLVEDADQKRAIVDYLASQERDLSPGDSKQALTLEGGRSLFNRVGLACGTVYKLEKAEASQYYIILPGPPYEFETMVEGELKAYLQEEIYTNQLIESLYLNFTGIGEAALAANIDDLILNQGNPTIAIYAKPRHLTIRLTANAPSQDHALALNQSLADEILDRLGEHFMGYGADYSLASHIVELLSESEQSLALAEPFTGGMICQELTENPQGLNCVRGAYMVYGSMAERACYGQELSEFEGDIVALAQDCRQTFEADYGLAVVGSTSSLHEDLASSSQVSIAIVTKSGDSILEHFDFSRRPLSVARSMAKSAALNLLRQLLREF